MKTKTILILLVFSISLSLTAQDKKPAKFEMSIQNIMRDQKWIGNFPSNPYWSEDGKNLYFMWNPENAKGDSLYTIDLPGGKPRKVTKEEQKKFPPRGAYNEQKTKMLIERQGDILIKDIKSGILKQLTRTNEFESQAEFTRDSKKVTYVKDNNLYLHNLETAEIVQLTDFKKDTRNSPADQRPAADRLTQNDQSRWLQQQQMKLFDFLKNRTTLRDGRRRRGSFGGDVSEIIPRPKQIDIENKSISGIKLSPDERFVTFRLYKMPSDTKGTIVPNYVTSSGYTEEIQARSKVGGEQGVLEIGVYDLKKDSVYYLDAKNLPGICEYPEYLKEYPNKKVNSAIPRPVNFMGPYYSDDGKYCAFSARSLDNKDKWIIKLDMASGKMTPLFRERNEAWIGGPGSYTIGWMPDNKKVWFQSEESGYSHIYTADVESGEVKQLTKGNYEIFSPSISKDKKYWYFTSSEVHPGERHYYKMPINGGRAEQITKMTGDNESILSPDEKYIALLYSCSNKPAELYIMENKPGAEAGQITNSVTDEFKSYPWRDPEIITFKAEDGATVYARLYKPRQSNKNGAGVIFVHGAGYLQNVHKWWSDYSHEYMFHNLLADEGYTVLDIDYRGSAGYGRDWRTGIYRFMGGKDLSDHVDGAKYLVEKLGVEAGRIGIYGGSYGGFITLMAMFTKPGVFAAGAALRSVTDWAHYNHGYTANILNIPAQDSLAYVKSSPIYYAEGLKGALLICHGMVDDNVHFQDVVRLSQRLIELGKDNWELAVFPIESHGFTDPKSWTDEYKRIYKLFNTNLLIKK